jgi:hypothetical protein
LAVLKAVAMKKRITVGAFALFIGVACTIPCLAQSAQRSAQAKQAEQAIADRLAAFIGTDKQVAANVAAMGRTSGAGIAFAREHMPWLLHSGGVDLYLKSLQKCEAGEARHCGVIDLMLSEAEATPPAAISAPSSPTRCISVPIGQGMMATRCD